MSRIIDISLADITSKFLTTILFPISSETFHISNHCTKLLNTPKPNLHNVNLLYKIQLLQNDLRPGSFLHVLIAIEYYIYKAILYNTKIFFRLQYFNYDFQCADNVLLLRNKTASGFWSFCQKTRLISSHFVAAISLIFIAKNLTLIAKNLTLIAKNLTLIAQNLIFITKNLILIGNPYIMLATVEITKG